MGAAIYPPPSSPNFARGLVAPIQMLGTSAYVGNTETMIYTQQFTAQANRSYKVVMRMPSVDTDGAGDNTNSTIRYAKQGAITYCRWAAGATVTTASQSVGNFYTTTFDDDSVTSMGLMCEWYIVNPPAGLITVGISLFAYRSPHTTYGMVRYLPSASATLGIEDVGPA
ncbi:hypothetical protein SEA_VERSE_24 [Streptomyces phage Verse]|uniref:DUF7298 domain-containing protein n=2 Tax=Streptomyces phage Amela TaxID=1673877 RepID=A0A0K1YA72_9CAUD|nr:hypothetical protein AVT29_gp24 [Streptomyces phage Amela]AKY03779.1 hypothetical protein SEA_AMELA_24 [Streptomyces phage Amela]AKY03854.1 hypothetical protein SEA_VERSE_24 [Streptomyces phage Verse]